MIEPTRDDEVRKTRLTGSTYAGFIGYSPWADPLTEWEYAQGYREFKGNDDTEAGQDMEDGILRNALRRLGMEDLEVIERDPKVDPDPIAWMKANWDKGLKPGTIVHPLYPDQFAVTPDLVIPSQKMGIQAKNHIQWASKRYKGKPQEAGRWDNPVVPREKLVQCYLELEVVSQALGPEDWDMWFLASYFGGSNNRLYWLRKDTRAIASMLRAGKKFWARHLDPNGELEPPGPDCDCGGCGRGRRWWIGPYKFPDKPIKLTPVEQSYAPPLFGTDEAYEDIFKGPFSEG